jgi:alkylation response protein AidB-like acyl-CoA dehydrogenase
MAFGFTDEQEGLRTAVRSFLEHVSPESEVRRLMETGDGFDRMVWRRAAQELGLQGLIVPEALGGSGAGFIELAIIAEEMGRRLLPGPYLSAVLATAALLESGDDGACKEHLPGIAAGDTIATLAVAEASGSWAATDVRCRATLNTQDDVLLDGVKELVTDAHVADLLIVAARGPEGVALYRVVAGAPGLTVTPQTTFDRTRRLARVELRDVPARPLGGADEGTLERVLLLGGIALSAEQVGGAQEALDMAVQYAKDRVQFGRAIGSFQAIKHLLADTLLEVESARSAAYNAAWSAADGDPELPTVAPLAKAYCSDAFSLTASNNMQVHGGISFTWEHPAHLYYRRAKSSAQLLGSPRAHRELLAQRLGL